MSLRTLLLAAVCMTVIGRHTLYAQDAGEMVVRVYPVANLIRSVPDFPYQPGLPTTDVKQPPVPAASSLGAGGFGGGGFGGGGAGGGGFFQIGAVAGAAAPQTSSDQQQVDLNALIAVITTSIAPATWNFTGGDATIVALGTSLVVRQTPDVHKEIQALLQSLSQMSDRQTMVTIRAFIVTVPPGTNFERDANGGDFIHELQRFTDETGEITCFSGQQVHLATGNRKNVVTSITPVVSAAVAGYQPIMAYPNIGTLLEFTTTVDPGGKSAMLDVRCTVTDWIEGGDPIRILSESGPGTALVTNLEGSGGRSEGTIDRINMGTRQLATTVRVPVSAKKESPIPVIVGTLGRPAPAADQKDGAAGLTYLIVAVSRK